MIARGVGFFGFGLGVGSSFFFLGGGGLFGREHICVYPSHPTYIVYCIWAWAAGL